MTCAPQSASRQQEDMDVDHSVGHRVAIVATSVLVLAGLSMYLPPAQNGRLLGYHAHHRGCLQNKNRSRRSVYATLPDVSGSSPCREPAPIEALALLMEDLGGATGCLS